MAEELTVGILVFDGVEVLDFTGPFEVFSVTRRGDTHDVLVGTTKPEEVPYHERPPAFRVLLVAEATSQPVTTTGGMKVQASVDYTSCPALDVLVVPGGMGTRKERFNASTQRFILQHVPSVRVLASVCTGSLILSEVGLLDGRRATTHWKALDLMEQAYPNVHVVRTKHWVREETDATEPKAAVGSSPNPGLPNSSTAGLGKETPKPTVAAPKLLFTSAGISAGIDMALKIVEELLGEPTARGTALHMEYPYPESDERRVPPTLL